MFPSSFLILAFSFSLSLFMQLCSRTAEKRGDRAGRGIRQRHDLLQRHRGLHIHVCREHAATGAQCLIANLSFVCFWQHLSVNFSDFQANLKAFKKSVVVIAVAVNSPFSTHAWKVLTGSPSTVCLIVRVPTHRPRLKIVQLLDGRVRWLRVESRYATTYLPLTLIPKWFLDFIWKICLLMDNITLSGELESPWEKTKMCFSSSVLKKRLCYLTKLKKKE